MHKLKIRIIDSIVEIPLEEECWKCNGTGKEESGIKGHMQDCYICNGHKSFPTENGEAIIALIEKYG